MVKKISDVIQGNYFHWEGLNGDESRELIDEALLPYISKTKLEIRNRKSQRFMVMNYIRKVAPTVIETWSKYGEETIALIEYDNSLSIDVEKTLAVFAKPDATMDSYRYRDGFLVMEYIYSSRGITFSVAEPYPGEKNKSMEIIHLQLYQSTDLQYYLTDIGYGEEIRPYPRSPLFNQKTINNNEVQSL